jgi:hypothetical protein
MGYYNDFGAKITKPPTLFLRHKLKNCRSGFEDKLLINRSHRF